MKPVGIGDVRFRGDHRCCAPRCRKPATLIYGEGRGLPLCDDHWCQHCDTQTVEEERAYQERELSRAGTPTVGEPASC